MESPSVEREVNNTPPFVVNEVVNKSGSFFDLPESEQKEIVEKAAKESNRVQAEFMEKHSTGDASPFRHGSEGTHYACGEIANSDGETICCECSGHKCKE